MEFSKTKEFVHSAYDNNIVNSITEFIKIPNQSPGYDSEWSTNGLQERAVKFLTDWVDSQKVPNLKYEVIAESGKTPVIFMELAASAGCKTDEVILMYGHLDKQPPLTEQWSQGLHPYEPVIRDGKLYGRGGADDGYSTFAAIASIKALINQGKDHSRIVILIEACEESGSPDLEYYVKKLLPRLGNVGLVVCLDSGCGNYEQFWLTTSLRGIAAGILKVKVLTQGMHSGSASGIVPSSFRILRNILDRLEDSKTGKVLVQECYAEINPQRMQQIKDSAHVIGERVWSEFPFAGNTKPTDADVTELMINKTWRPQLSVVGASGFPEFQKAGNVLRTESAFKLSVRLPPTVDCNTALKALEKELTRDPPYGAQVTFSDHDGAAGWASPLLEPWLDNSVQSASKAFFGKPAMFIGEGGSIPFMGMLGELFPKAQFVVTGVLGPGSNAHGPDEFLHIEFTKNVTCIIAHILADFNVAKSKL